VRARRLLIAVLAVVLCAGAPAGALAASAVTAGAKVDAEVLGASAVRRASGKRVVVVELVADERIRVLVRVLRDQELVAFSRVFRLKPARWTITLPLPNDLTRGRAGVVVRMEDRSGNVRTYRQPVRVPARP
jgi:hypothetical protein